MRRLGLCLALAGLWALGACGGGRVTGEVGRACLAGGGASPQLCACIQGVADQVLSRGEQRRAARFFADPQEAQDARQSGRPGDESFWRRYRAFADHAAAVCG